MHFFFKYTAKKLSKILRNSPKIFLICSRGKAGKIVFYFLSGFQNNFEDFQLVFSCFSTNF